MFGLEKMHTIVMDLQVRIQSLFRYSVHSSIFQVSRFRQTRLRQIRFRQTCLRSTHPKASHEVRFSEIPNVVPSRFGK